MNKVLFICHGNICRSPMAEYIFKNMVREAGLEDEFVIASAATSTEEIGNDIYPPAKRILKEHSIPFGLHHARQITSSDLLEYDYIIAMEDYNIKNMIRRLGESDKYHLLLEFTGENAGISDPWYSGDFETAYKEIERGCRGLLESIRIL